MLRIVVVVTMVSAGLGAGFGGAMAPAHEGSAVIPVALASGALSGVLLTLFEILLRGVGAAMVRRLPVVVIMAFRTAVYAAVFIGTSYLAGLVLDVLAPRVAAGSPTMVTGAGLAISLAASLVINFVFMLRALLGPGTLVALATGRYHRPRREERVVLFLDLRDSTRLAERLGDLDFHRFLNRVFHDVTDPVLETGGDIYRYVGDEIIVTWKKGRAPRGGGPIACLAAIAARLARRRASYLREFGAEPHLRGALHAGPLIVGEMGDLKREIVMLGDTMNTAARLEQLCRETGHDFVLSRSGLDAAGALPEGVLLLPLGAVPVRGKAREIELFALERGASAAAL
jgi:adenylate cyclase